MTLDPLLTAPPLIQAHVACALLALALGPIALLRRSRDLWHRLAGAGFVAAMLGAAGTSFWIRESGGFSWIHVLSVLTLVGVAQGLWALWRGDRKGHGRQMRMLYAQALILPAIFTMLPGRRMSAAFAPEDPWTGFALSAVLGAAVALWLMWPRARPGARLWPGARRG